MTEALRNAACRGLGVGAALVFCGCTVDLSGLNQLLDPDPTYLSLPGRKLAAGRFTAPALGGTDAEGAFALAVEHEGDPSARCQAPDDACSIAIVPFNDPGQGKCNTGPSDRSFRAFQFGVRDTRPVSFSYTFTDTSGADDQRFLHFVSPTCEETLAPIPGGALPFWPNQPTDQAPGYLTLTQTGDFLLLKPWLSQVETIASGVRLIRPTEELFWSLERHPDALDEDRYQLVVRDQRLRELGRVGDDVDEFDVTDLSNERAAYVEGGALKLVTRATLSSTAELAEDACEVAFPTGFQGRGLSYFSPCDDRRLVVRGAPTTTGGGEETYTLAGTARGDPAILYRDKQAYVFYVTTDDGEPATLTLWGSKLGEAPEELGNAPSLGSAGAPRVTSVTEGFQFMVDVQGGVGRLVRWKPGSKIREIATDVAECTGQLCLANFDGELGDALFVPGSGDPQRIARGVPRGVMTSDRSGLGLLAEVADGVGTFLVGRRDGTGFEEVARGVPGGGSGALGYQFLRNLAAVAYVRDYDAATGTGAIGVRAIETGDTFDTGVRASEWREIGWPQPGLLYVVPEGAGQGLWFAPLM